MTSKIVLLLMGSLLLLPGGATGRVTDVAADVGVTGTVSAVKVFINQPITFTFTVTNAGPDRANIVRLNSDVSRGVVGTPTGTNGANCTLKGRRVACLHPFLEATQSYQVTFTVTNTSAGDVSATTTVQAVEPDPTPANQQVALQSTVLVPDKAPPTDPHVSGLRAFTTSSPIDLAWTAKDAISGVISYKVRYRSAPWAGSFGPYLMWKDTKEKTATFLGVAGSTYCFSISATDLAGNTSAFGAESCTSVPLSALVFHRTGTWGIATSADFYRQHAVVSATKGSTLTLAGIRAKLIVLLVTRCTSCGKLTVSWNGTETSTVKLRGDVKHSAQVVIFRSAVLRVGTLTLTVPSKKKGGLVQVEGLGVGKT